MPGMQVQEQQHVQLSLRVHRFGEGFANQMQQVFIGRAAPSSESDFLTLTQTRNRRQAEMRPAFSIMVVIC